MERVTGEVFQQKEERDADIQKRISDDTETGKKGEGLGGSGVEK